MPRICCICCADSADLAKSATRIPRICYADMLHGRVKTSKNRLFFNFSTPRMPRIWRNLLRGYRGSAPRILLIRRNLLRGFRGSAPRIPRICRNLLRGFCGPGAICCADLLRKFRGPGSSVPICHAYGKLRPSWDPKGTQGPIRIYNVADAPRSPKTEREPLIAPLAHPMSHTNY